MFDISVACCSTTSSLAKHSAFRHLDSQDSTLPIIHFPSFLGFTRLLMPSAIDLFWVDTLYSGWLTVVCLLCFFQFASLASKNLGPDIYTLYWYCKIRNLLPVFHVPCSMFSSQFSMVTKYEHGIYLTLYGQLFPSLFGIFLFLKEKSLCLAHEQVHFSFISEFDICINLLLWHKLFVNMGIFFRLNLTPSDGWINHWFIYVPDSGSTRRIALLLSVYLLDYQYFHSSCFIYGAHNLSRSAIIAFVTLMLLVCFWKRSLSLTET